MSTAADSSRPTTRQEALATLAQAIDEATSDSALSFANMARELRTDVRVISRWRSGERCPSGETLLQLERVLRITDRRLTKLRDDVDRATDDDRAARRASVKLATPPVAEDCKRRRWTRPRVIAGVVLLAAVVIAAVVGIGVLGGTGDGEPNHGSAAGQRLAPELGAQRALKRHTEIADVRAGIQLYRDTRGTGANMQNIPFGTRVGVACVAPNHSGITSINALYIIDTPPWRGLFASANQFANGAPLGVTTNADPVDRQVAACKIL